MKVLMISGIPILPANEGNRSRMLALSRAIRAQGHELWLALLPAGLSAPNDREAHLREFGAGRVLELRPETPPQRAMRLLRWLPFRLRRKICRKLDLPVGFYSGLDERFRSVWTAQLADLQNRHGFDIAFLEYVFHSAALEAFPAGMRKVIDTHDSFADRHRPYVEKGILHDYWFSMHPADEARGFRRADAIIAIQPEEAVKFQVQLGDHPDNPEVLVVNHFLDIPEPPEADHAGSSGLFLASNNPANTLSARGFIADVLPLILQQMPDFRLTLAGLICEVVEDHPAIVKLGLVDRLSDAFAQAPLLINPMVVGTGINIKMLDAMAAGVPAVSTETGVRGMPTDYMGSVEVVADDDHQGFADRIVALLRDEPRRREMGRIARENALRWNAEQYAALRPALEGGSAEGGCGE